MSKNSVYQETFPDNHAHHLPIKCEY